MSCPFDTDDLWALATVRAATAARGMPEVPVGGAG